MYKSIYIYIYIICVYIYIYRDIAGHLRYVCVSPSNRCWSESCCLSEDVTINYMYSFYLSKLISGTGAYKTVLNLQVAALRGVEERRRAVQRRPVLVRPGLAQQQRRL